jgi:hypothetical protein
MDLFIGGRLTPWRYPIPADSYLLQNNNGKFIDITGQAAPDLVKIGMVTCAVWSDFDLDGDHDLILAGEWMPVMVLVNENGSFRKSQKLTGLEKSTGWWWSLVAFDFDRDGDEDLVVGNQGYNNRFKASREEPFIMYSSDFDQNGSQDIVLGIYIDHQLYPLRHRNILVRQIPWIGDKFSTDNDYALATLPEVLGEEAIKNSMHYKVQTFATSYFENQGDGTFTIVPLGNRAQISSTNGIIVYDVDGDSYSDLILAGNLFSMEEESVRNDAGTGAWMKGNGKGDFQYVPFSQGGLFLDGNIKDLKMITLSSGGALLVARNNDSIGLFRIIK